MIGFLKNICAIFSSTVGREKYLLRGLIWYCSKDNSSFCHRKKELGLDLVASPRFSEKFTWNSNLKKLRLTSISRQFVTLSVGVSASLPTSNKNRSCLSSYSKTSMRPCVVVMFASSNLQSVSKTVWVS